ncbi:MAG: hypothetical protein WBC60_08550 [Cognaticolwellia sp.]
MDGLPKPLHRLLLALVNDTHKQKNKVFDKHDNCFQKGQRHMALITGKSKSSINRLFVTMKDKDLVRKVIDCEEVERDMLNPVYIWCKPDKYNRLFHMAMYHLGSDDRARKWARQCKNDAVLWDYTCFGEVVDIITGEITHGCEVRKLSTFELYQWEKSRVTSTCWDRTKRRA